MEAPAASMANAITLTFTINKGDKVRVNSVNISGNDHVTELKLKKQMKGTKEMTRITLFPLSVKNPFGDTTHNTMSFKEYMSDMGFLSVTKTRQVLDPYFRFKMFSSAKFSEKKFDEDKEKVLDYYNSSTVYDQSNAVLATFGKFQ